VTGRIEDVDQLLADLQRSLPDGPTTPRGPTPTSAELASPIVFIEPE
jgi:hypothetical protein